MKITKRQLRRLIIENLELNEGDMTSQLVTEINILIDSSSVDDHQKSIAKNSVKAIEGLKGVNLADFLSHSRIQKVLKKFGFLGTSVTAAGALFSSYVFVSGMFLALPVMIKKHIAALNTVPGKLRNIAKYQERPVNSTDVARNPQGLFVDITKNLGINKIPRDDMINFLAIGIGLTNKDSSSNNVIQKLFQEQVVTEEFYTKVLERYYKLREEKNPENIKKNLLTKVKQFLEDNPDDTTLTVAGMLDIVTSIV